MIIKINNFRITFSLLSFDQQFQQALKELLRTSFQDFVEDVVENHLGVLIAAVEPKDVVFAHCYFELAMLCYYLKLDLKLFLSASEAVDYHTVFQFAKCTLSRISWVKARQLRADELAILAHSRIHNVSRVQVWFISLSDSIKVQCSKHSIQRCIDINNEVLTCFIFDDSNDELVDFWYICTDLFDDVNALLAIIDFLDKISKVE